MTTGGVRTGSGSSVETPVSDLDNNIVRSIKDTLSIVDVVSDYISLQRRGRTYVGLCPFHDDHRPSLDVDPDRARYRCWACGAVGDVFSWVMAMENVSFPEALQRLAERAGIDLPRRHVDPKRVELDRLRSAVRWALDQFVAALWQPSLGRRAREYLESRGFRGETLRRFSIGYAPPRWDWLVERAVTAGIELPLLARVGLVRERRDGGFYDWFRDRVIFPIFDLQGRPIAFGGRVLPDSADQAAKYINSPETPLFSKRATLYSLHIARRHPMRDAQTGARRLVIVEGYTDCLALHQAGIACAVATLGTALSEQHVGVLRRYVDGAVLVFDADEAGARAADRALDLFLRTGFDARICVLPAGADPADYIAEHGAEGFLDCVGAATEPLLFRLNRARKIFPVHTVTGQQQALDYVLQPLVERRRSTGDVAALSPDESLLIDRIVQELRVSYQTVVGRFQRLARSRRSRSVAEQSGPGSEQDVSNHLEKELLAVLLVWPEAVEFVRDAFTPEIVDTPWIREAVQEALTLAERGIAPTVENLALKLGATSEWLERLHGLAEFGHELLTRQSREAWIRDLVQRMEERRLDREAERVRRALQEKAGDAEGQRALLRRLHELRRARQKLTG